MPFSIFSERFGNLYVILVLYIQCTTDFRWGVSALGKHVTGGRGTSTHFVNNVSMLTLSI